MGREVPSLGEKKARGQKKVPGNANKNIGMSAPKKTGN